MTGLARRVNNEPELVLSSHAYGFFVIASEAKQSRAKKRLDCFVASLLAMTGSGQSDGGIPKRIPPSSTQDEGGACGPCSGSFSPNTFVKSATCSGDR